MKKFLTVLLALSVVFTYTFGTAGSVFAAEQYSLDDYAKVLTAEKAAQLTYLDKAKAQAVGAYTYDKDGFTTDGYMEAAYIAAADKVISDLTTAMDDAINSVLNGTFPTSVAPDKTVVSSVCVVGDDDATTAAGMKALLEKETATLDKAQAPLTKAYAESKLSVDLTKYNSTDKAYEGNTLTAAQAVQKAIDEAKTDIANADKLTTDADKMKAYKDAADKFDAAIGAIKTLADEAYEGGINAGTVEAAVEQLANLMLTNIATDLAIKADMAADDTVDWSVKLTNWAIKAFWEADSTNANKGELFGVAIANTQKVTRDEVAAVNAAYKAAVASAKAPIIAYADGDVSKISVLANDKVGQYGILANAMEAADKYADVVAAGEKMKATYEIGVKIYDDAAVDQAVKAAEALVYADLKTGFKANAKDYIDAAADKEGITLKAENYELQKFNKAVQDAAKKMYQDGTAATTVQVKVSYGDDKTADADLVYLKGTYDTTASADWDKIATAAVADLKNAQSYDEINVIMAQAAEDFGKLLKAADAKEVIDARALYVKALNDYADLKAGLLNDTTAYPTTTINAVKAQGEKLINKATTVDGVKAAYEEAKALVDSLKTADELNAAKEAVEKQIAALPYTSTLTIADKAAVKAAYDAYDAYMNMAGASDIAPASKALLQEKYNKVNELEAKAIEEKAKALNDQLSKLTNSDADIAAKAALKADVDAVIAEADALKDEIADVNDNTYNFSLSAVTLTEANKLDAADVMDAVAEDALIKLLKATKEGATVEEMQAALDAYNALTDKQKYTIDARALQYVKIVETKLNAININAVEALKITASSSAVKGSITVKWTVKGDSSAADGFQVYRSLKMNSGFGTKAFFTTTDNTKRTYKNTKSLKKGTRYYYKIRAYKVVDGVKYYSDWSNKAYRIAK